MGLFSKKTCGHQGSAPWGTVRCTKPSGHGGRHGARGLTWGADGKVRVGRRGSSR